MDAIDRKLIEDAACAAGWTIDHWGEDNKGVPVAYRINERGGHSAFQPLYENGCCDCMSDALRLAVELGLTINPYKQGVFVSRYEDEEVIAEPFDAPGCNGEATRRAIVRAAASIGQSQENQK